MALLDAFSPEKLIRSLGIDPQQAVDAYRWLQQAIVTFNEKLNVLQRAQAEQQAQLDRIEAPLAVIAAQMLACPPPARMIDHGSAQDAERDESANGGDYKPN